MYDFGLIFSPFCCVSIGDDRFHDGEDLEIFNNNEVMSRVALKGTFPIRCIFINKKFFFFVFIVKLTLK
jgi:hypothetical protein